MIAPTGSALLSDFGVASRPGAGRRALRVTVALETVRVGRTAPPPRPRPLAQDLDRVLADGASIVADAPARAAARAFAAGTGFLPGQIIDRVI